MCAKRRVNSDWKMYCFTCFSVDALILILNQSPTLIQLGDLLWPMNGLWPGSVLDPKLAVLPSCRWLGWLEPCCCLWRWCVAGGHSETARLGEHHSNHDDLWHGWRGWGGQFRCKKHGYMAGCAIDNSRHTQTPGWTSRGGWPASSWEYQDPSQVLFPLLDCWFPEHTHFTSSDLCVKAASFRGFCAILSFKLLRSFRVCSHSRKPSWWAQDEKKAAWLKTWILQNGWFRQV